MNNLNIVFILGAAAVVVAGIAFRAKAELPEAKAREYLKHGAVVVDVRTVAEYNAGHLTNTINIPLDQVTTKFPATVTNKGDVVLIHCRSGHRSGIAVGKLRELGYTNVFNLGSFEKARKILEPEEQKR